MRFPFCPQEEKIAAMLRANRWPQEADPLLVEHAAACGRCSEVVFALEMLRSRRSSAVLAAPSPASPGSLWWRAQFRRKSGVLEQATRPIVWAEGLALAVMLCIVAGFGIWQRAQLFDLLHSFVGLSIIGGLAAILCVGGITLFLSDRTQ